MKGLNQFLRFDWNAFAEGKSFLVTGVSEYQDFDTKSIIDRCVRKLYIDIARSKEKYIPVMSDFYDILIAQPEDEAKDIALSLELFVNGSLLVFTTAINDVFLHNAKRGHLLNFFRKCPLSSSYLIEFISFQIVYSFILMYMTMSKCVLKYVL